MRINIESESDIPCCFCRGKYFNLLFSALDFDNGKEFYHLMECTQCHLVRTAPILNNAQLQRFYSLPYYGSGKEKFKGLTETITYLLNYRRAGSILSYLKSRKKFSSNNPLKILDLGCGRGNLLRALKEKGCDCYGVERGEFPDLGPYKGIHFFKGNLSEQLFEENFFDTVILWHVLEHTDNPIAILQEIARIIKFGGILAMAVPNFGSFQTQLFRSDWFHLDLPRHTHHFNPNTLFQCLNQNGFEIINKNTFSLEQNPFGFIQSLFNKIPNIEPNRFYSLLKKTGGPSSLFSLLIWAVFAALILPFALLETLISGLMGKGASLMVYAEKR